MAFDLANERGFLARENGSQREAEASPGSPASEAGETAAKKTPPRCALALRADLPEEHRIIQAAHAAMEAGARFGLPEGEPLHFALFEVADEAELLELADRIEAEGLRLALFNEPDGDTGATAFATEPFEKGACRALKKARKWPGRRLGR
jgi:hypothetical protein